MQRAIQDCYPDDYAHCYGCGRSNPSGLHIRTYWHEGEARTEFTPRPEHAAGQREFVYGGLLASLLDCHAMATAAAALAEQRGMDPGTVPRCVTAALHVDYLKPTPQGTTLVLRGRVTGLGRRKAEVEATVEAHGEITVRAQVIAVAVRGPEDTL